jgi:hypothetical protein
MYPFDEFKVIYCVSSQCRRKWHGKIFEAPKILPEVCAFDVVDDVQESNASTGIIRCLA